MGSLIVIFVVGFLFYALTRGFIKSPSINKININQKQNFSGNIKDHEAGLLIALMAKVAKADGVVSELEAELIKHTLDDISRVFENNTQIREQLKQIYKDEKDDFSNTLIIAQKYQNLTKFSYEKRLGLMEYLLNLAFIDGDYSEHERMITEDIAKALHVKPNDLAQMVSRFNDYYTKKQSQSKMNLKEAYSILGANESDDFALIKKKYRNLVKQNHPDILMGQGKSQDIINQATAKLQKINEAYEMIKEQKNRR